ncbi:MAG: calcium/sodium antiporter [Thermoplasmata archaeon]|nr:calcium/sodium antiporter [Thermoplasmata archaeon]
MKKLDLIYLPVFLLLAFLLYFNPFPSSFFLSVIHLLLGCFVLIKGSAYFVESTVDMAAKLGVSEHTIGLTVVAFGTSLPELAVSGIASYGGHVETAWGNVVGSNVTNILLILGVAMIITSIRPSKYAFRDAITMLAISIITIFLIFDGGLQFYDGILLLSFYFIFVYMLRKRGIEGEEMVSRMSPLLTLLFFVAGMAGVAMGADGMVRGAVSISSLLGVKEVAIAASIVALGTSLPELATSVVAAMKKHHGIAVGNVIGSNIMNLGLVLGFSSLLHTIPISISSVPLLFFLLVSIATPVILYRKWVGKVTGSIMLLLYVLFLIFVYL